MVNDATVTTTPWHRAGIATLMALALGACALGPNHVRPELELPAAHPGTTARVSPEAADLAFWQRFGDPVLVELIEQALSSNRDLAVALANWDQAIALLGQSRSERWPSLSVSGQAGSHRSSAGEAPGLERARRDVDRYDIGVAASWELDLFGRIRRQVQAQTAQAAATANDLYAAQVAVVGETAASYVRLRGYQARLKVALDHGDNQRRTLELVDTRLEAGLGTPLDNARARAQLASTQALIPGLEHAVAQERHRLAVLTGHAPGTLDAMLDASPDRLLLPADPVPAGTPADLLRRRPDIIAAEQRLAAATARIGVATADLFPRLTLGGLIGTQAVDAGALFERDSERRWLALGIDWTFLDAGRVRARIAAAEAGADAELARYQQTVLVALEEVANALVRQQQAQREVSHLHEATQASADAADLARIQYDGGLIEFLQVLDSERTRLDAEDRLVQARTSSVLAMFDIFRGLAGGWPAHLPIPAHAHELVDAR